MSPYGIGVEKQQLETSGYSRFFEQGERLLFIATVVAAAAILWLAPRLPMVDLPQHAGQVALWRDLLLGQSSWTDVVRINLFTPYLLGYGLMLPLSFVFSMEVTTRIVITAALLAFVGASVGLRREFGASKRLDWLFVLSFFGYCWKWGFLTFLVASPVGLLFLFFAVRHARDPSFRKSAALIATGTVLLFSHGLVFLGFLGITGLQMLEQVWVHKSKNLVARFLPYIILFALSLGFRLLTQNMEGALQNAGYLYGTALWERPLTLLFDITDTNDDNGSLLLLGLTCVLLCAPFLYGLRLNSRAALMPAAGLLIILLAGPTDAFQTGGLYYRFALFIPPFVAFAFRDRDGANSASFRSHIALILVAASSWWVLAVQGTRIAAFAQESSSFDTVLAAAKPGMRALATVLDGDSVGAANSNAYWHYPVWYQANKHGFVDFNFALFPPQVIRFKSNRNPSENDEVDVRIGQNKMWSKQFISKFQYIFVRGKAEKILDVKHLSPCPMSVISHDGPWYLLETTACAIVK